MGVKQILFGILCLFLFLVQEDLGEKKQLFSVTALFLSQFQFRGFKVIFAPLKLVKKIILNII